MKVALVTASSAGLGAAIAKNLARDMRVVINYNSSPEKADRVFKEMEEIASQNPAASGDSGPRFLSIQADLSQRSEVERLVAETVEKMGRLDIVVSNGGWTRLVNFHNFDENLNEDDWDRCFNMNVKSQLRILENARKHLDEAKGAFVSIASVAGSNASGSSVPYAVSKAAQIHLIKCVAKSVAPGVRVNSVSPGLLLTEWGLQFPPEVIDKIKQLTPLDDVATVEDVAEMVRSVALNKSLTGQNIVVDSGLSI